ncbi:MAG: ABC transporter permease [Gemmatimonadetes bacterium]|nr:ABC transporter permease [Gemmatimonadota bacterium]
MTSFIQDIRYGLRNLRRRRAFTAMAIATLALGIGATSAIYSVVDTVLIRPLPYDEPDRLVQVYNTYPFWRGHEVLDALWDNVALSYPEFATWRESQSVFDDVAVYGSDQTTLTGGDQPERVTVGLATASLLPVLGVAPLAGRWFALEEDVPGGNPVAVISFGLAQRYFGASLDATGQSLVLDGSTYTVIGVLPRHFPLPQVGADVWTPLGQLANDLDEGNHSFYGIARLSPDMTVESALPETISILRGARSPEARGARIVLLQDVDSAGMRAPLFILLGAVAILLLIACGNIANLLLGETSRRQREIAVRSAIGAGKLRIVRQLLTESTVLAVLGGLAAIVVAHFGTKALVSLAPLQLPRLDEVGLDIRVLLFTGAITLGTGFVFGLVPAFAAAQTELRSSLAATAGQTGSRRLGMSGVVASVEVALATVLLIAGALLGQSLLRLASVDPGFASDDRISVQIALPASRYPESADIAFFYDQALERLGALPGVSSVTSASMLPLTGHRSNSFEIQGRENTGDSNPEAQLRVVSPRYLETMGIDLLSGRFVTDADITGAENVVVINQHMADRFWPRENAVGKRITMRNATRTIVGVVGNVRSQGLQSEPQPTIYAAYSQVGTRSANLVLHTSLDLETIVPSIRAALRELDRDLPVTDIQALPALVSRSLSQERYRTLLIGVFAVIAAMLAGLGIYGTMARMVSSRIRELGIRVALGATPRHILGMLMSQTALLAASGVFAGIIVALAATRVLQGFLYDIRAVDPLTYIAMALAIFTLSVFATAPAVLRALKVDIMTVLRQE